MQHNKIFFKFFKLYFPLIILLNYSNAVSASDNKLIEFSLITANQKSHFNFSSNNYEIKYQQLGLNWYESFSPYFHAGLELGYINITQAENPTTSAQFTSGEYTGLLLRLLPIKKERVSLIVNLNYRYHQTKGKSINQETEFRWSEITLSSELQFQATENIGLFLSAEYTALSGKQLDSGNINQSVHFNNLAQQSYRAGFDFALQRSEFLRIEWQIGSKNGIQIYFTRKL